MPEAPWGPPVCLVPAAEQTAVVQRPRCADGQLPGAQYSTSEIELFLNQTGARYHYFSDEAKLLEHVAQAMTEEKAVGWFHGRMEFGPRALGARSIIGDPRSTQMQAVMNLKVKFRESFRPFAPCVLREHVHEWFQMRPNEDALHAHGRPCPGQASPYALCRGAGGNAP